MNHFIVCTESKQKLKEFMYSMILHDQEYDHRPKIYIREERESERAKTTSKYSHMYANMPVERRLALPRMP